MISRAMVVVRSITVGFDCAIKFWKGESSVGFEEKKLSVLLSLSDGVTYPRAGIVGTALYTTDNYTLIVT